MKKIFLSLMCLLIISMGVCCASASDNTTMAHDSIQTIDQQNVPVDSSMNVENDLNNNVTVDNVAVKIADNITKVQPTNKTSILDIQGPKNNNTIIDIQGPKINGLKLDIQGPKNDSTIIASQGPKINGPKLDIQGPKVNGPKINLKGPKSPVITVSGPSKFYIDVNHYAKIFFQHPEWNITKCIDYFFKTADVSPYNDLQVTSIICKAHNLAFHAYNGTSKMATNKKLTDQDVYQSIYKYLCGLLFN